MLLKKGIQFSVLFSLEKKELEFVVFFPSEMGKGSASLAISLILYPEKGKKECVSLNLFMCFSFFFLSQIEMCQVNLLYVKRCYIP